MNKKLNFAVIFNANAAGGRKLKLINKVINLLEKNHIVDLFKTESEDHARNVFCLLYTSPSPRDGLLSRMPSSG